MQNLQLSRHGIWYFRKVTITPQDKRKETKKSLRTRDKSVAKQKVIDLLACTVTNRSTCVASLPTPNKK